jgi:hypothetical protein
MEIPAVANGQFVDTVALTNVISTLVGTIATVGKRLHTAGLLNPASLVFTPSLLTIQVQMPLPFLVLFGTGHLVPAHGLVNDADTSTTTVSLAGLVPGSGSVTAYVVASVTTIGQSLTTVIGPPPGHPDYDPTFSPFEFDTITQDTIALTATLSAPDNATTFELCRVTLSVGQSTITGGQIDKTHWVYASAVLNPQVAAGAYAGGAAVTSASIDGRASAAFGTYATASGTVNALTATLSPAPAAQAALLGVPLKILTAGINTGAATLNVNGFGPQAIRHGDGAAVAAGDLAGGQIATVLWNGVFYQLLNPSSLHPGTTTMVVLTTSGSFTVPNNVTTVKVKVWAGGGGGGSADVTGGAGSGGTGGGYAEGWISVTPLSVITCTVGLAGAGSITGTVPGGAGGTSTFGGLIGATGGLGGSSTSSTTQPAAPGTTGSGVGGTLVLSGGPAGQGVAIVAGVLALGGWGGGAYGTSSAFGNTALGIGGQGPGGGGSGGANGNHGGPGYAGLMIIEY